MGVKCSRRRLHTETRIYMLKWSNPCECTVRVIEVVEQRRLGLERAGEGWGEVGCEYGSMGGRGEILRDRTRLRGVGGSGGVVRYKWSRGSDGRVWDSERAVWVG